MDRSHSDKDDGAHTTAGAGSGVGGVGDDGGGGGAGGDGAAPGASAVAGGAAVELPGYLAEALATIRAGITDVLDARAGALTSGQARRLIREVTAVSAQLYGAQLHTLRVLTEHPDTPPTRGQTSQSGPPNQSVKTYLTSGLHLDPAHAGRDLAAARLLDPDTGDLPAVAAALAAGAIGPDAVTIAVRTHRALGATVRDRVDHDGHRLIGRGRRA